MSTDEEIQTFVQENRELVVKMMNLQKEALEKTVAVGSEITKDAMESTKEAAEFARDRSIDFFNATAEMITSPVVQKHFMTASIEFIAGLTAMAELAPVPAFMKEAASDFDKNFKQAACKANERCPAKKVEIQAPEASEE